MFGVGSSPQRASRSRKPRARRFYYLLALAVLFCSVVALGESPAAPGTVSGTFSLGPGSLPAGEAGGSQLTVAPGGSQATIVVWISPGASIYFLDVAQFQVHVARADSVQLAVQLTSPWASLPNGTEVLGMFGTPAIGGSPGGQLGNATAVPGGALRSIEGMGAPEGSQPGVLTGLDVSPLGTAFVSNEDSADLHFTGPGDYLLVLSIGVVVPSSGSPLMGGTALTLQISLASAI